MARIFIDGGEASDMRLWDAQVGMSCVAAVTGMSGSYCIADSDSPYAYFKKTLVASKSELYFAFKLRCGSNSENKLINFYDSAGTRILNIHRLANSNYLTVIRGGTTLATGTIIIAGGVTYLIEIRVKPLNSGGIVQVKVNGLLDIDYSGDTTEGLENVQGFSLLNHPGEAYVWAYPIYFDDFVVDDAAWPGNTKIQAIVPTGAGASTQWAPSAGSNWQCVDEKPASEADSVSTNTTGHLDTYGVGDLAGSIENIKCVQVQALAVLEGAPTPLNLNLAVKSGATTYLSADKLVPAITSKCLAALWGNDPATAAPWEIAAVNAAEIGIKAVA